MAENKDFDQAPNSQHMEVPDPEKHESHVIIPDERQTSIRRKVGKYLGIIGMQLTIVQFDRRVLPIVCILYILSYLDRGKRTL